MKFEIAIGTNIILAIREFSAEKDIRSVINGINFEFKHDSLILVATTGEIMGAYRHATEIPESYIGKSITAPITLFKHVKSNKGLVWVTFEDKDKDQNYPFVVTVDHLGISTSGNEIPVKYIDWRRVVPSTVDHAAAQFQTCLLDKLDKAARTIHHVGKPQISPLVINHNGDGPALVSVSDEDNFIGVVMPLRKTAYKLVKSKPYWA